MEIKVSISMNLLCPLAYFHFGTVCSRYYFSIGAGCEKWQERNEMKIYRAKTKGPMMNHFNGHSMNITQK